MSTVQEIFTSGLANTPHPTLTRLQNLHFDGDASVIVNSVSYDYGFAENYSSTYNSITTSWNPQTGSKRVYPMGGTKAVLTYNLAKKLLVVTDCRPYNSSDANSLKLCARIGMIKTASSAWLYEGYSSFGSSYNINNDSNLTTFYNEYFGENPRKDVNGLISLQSDFIVKLGSMDRQASVNKRLTGGGVYLADGDITDFASDVGKIISDTLGNNYICCGCRLWMDYD